MARILVVESESRDRDLARSSLELAGHAVRCEPDAAAGLAAAAGGRIDLVVAAARMPGTDGIALLQALRSEPATSAIPVILLSDMSDREAFRRAMNVGADDVVGKPLDSEELIQSVSARLARFLSVATRSLPAAADDFPRTLPLGARSAATAAGPAATVPGPAATVPTLTEYAGADTLRMFAFDPTASYPIADLEKTVPLRLLEAAGPTGAARPAGETAGGTGRQRAPGEVDFPRTIPLGTRSAPVSAGSDSPAPAPRPAAGPAAAAPAAAGAAANRPARGTVLHIVTRNLAALGQSLGARDRREAAEIIQGRVVEPIVAQQGAILRASAQSVIAFFESRGTSPDHAARAARAALLVVLAVQTLRASLSERFGRHLGETLSVGIALESGELRVAASGGQLSASGSLIEDLAQVEGFLGPAAWSVAMGAECLRLAAGEFATGRAASFVFTSSTVPRTFIEVIGFEPQSGRHSGFEPVYSAVAAAIRSNQDVSASAFPEDLGLTLPAAPHPAAEEPQVDGYRLMHPLGEGGMSKVYLAEHQETGELRVLKMIPIDDDEDMLQRFLQEYALIAQVRHPNVARIFEQGFGAQCAYISMEYLSGGDLRDRLKHGIPVPEVLRFLAQIALGLTAIHDRGIIHRDLKPENLMFRSDGTLVLADFGIAKQLSTELTRTRNGEVYGTPFYMSPEQGRGFTVDGRSDLYALGVILYEMLVGAKPYTATRAEAIIYQHIHSPVPRLPERAAALQGLLDRLLAKRPEERFASALELMRELRSKYGAQVHNSQPVPVQSGAGEARPA